MFGLFETAVVLAEHIESDFEEPGYLLESWTIACQIEITPSDIPSFSSEDVLIRHELILGMGRVVHGFALKATTEGESTSREDLLDRFVRLEFVIYWNGKGPKVNEPLLRELRRRGLAFHRGRKGCFHTRYKEEMKV